MQFRLLSGVAAYSEGVWIHLGDRKQRLVLAILLLAESRPVPMEQLIDKVWGNEPIASARKVIHHYMSELRGHLGRTVSGSTDLLPKHDGGYRLLASRDQVDLHRFRDLVSTAQPLIRHDDARAVRTLRDALSQWGTPGLRVGEPLNDVTGQWALNHRHNLQEEHRAAVIDCMEAELRLGLHTRLIPELLDLTAAGPPDEQVTALLMLAYYRAGRSAEALAAFSGLRTRLAEEIGADPGADIERFHQRILQRDPGLDLPIDANRFTAAGSGSAADTDDPSGSRTESRSPDEVGRHAARLVAEGARKGNSKGIGAAWLSPSAPLIERVRTRFHGDLAAQGTLAQVELNPADVVAVTALERVLIMHLIRDLAFFEDITRLVDQAHTAKQAASGPAIVANTIKTAAVYHAPVTISGDFNIS
ncbi:AfsR/SARP family transcriptional regulator [Streptosporangium sp. KLBMP 9127]|nr:AfsR/SARP family transcriptional regulator [Streptosporangium sp. KLBMP 9127]